MNIIIKDEPNIVTEIRYKILDEFKDLDFVEDGHIYTLNGQQLMSVTNVTHKFQEPFDDIAQSIKYSEKHGETPEYWLDKWRYTSLKSTICGTRVHAYGESLGWLRNGHPELIVDEIKPQYIKDKNWLVPIHPKEESVIKFMDDLPDSYHLVLNEARVYSGKNPNPDLNLSEQICGTFDMLYYYDGNGNEDKAGCVILDYKTNSDIYKSFSRSRGKMLYPPFDDLYDEPLSIYTLQLSLYSLMLEDIGIKVIDRKLIWLKEDGTYEKITVPDVSEKLRKVL